VAIRFDYTSTIFDLGGLWKRKYAGKPAGLSSCPYSKVNINGVNGANETHLVYNNLYTSTYFNLSCVGLQARTNNESVPKTLMVDAGMSIAYRLKR
jgi:hypothetical protein